MERTMSVEEKIRRAEEIYARRQQQYKNNTATVSVKNTNKKNYRLLKKMLIQVLISLSIYLVIYVIQNNNYVFSEQFLKNINEVLSKDTSYTEIYNVVKNYINNKIEYIKNHQKVEENKTDENYIGGAEESFVEQENEIKVENNDSIINENIQLSNEEQEIKNIKDNISFIKPVQGVISSPFGVRNPTTSSVPKNHTGVDIAASEGTKIVSATDGEVVLNSDEGDYGKHLKIQNGNLTLIYGHCSKLYVNEGTLVKQGDEIAEVGSTGNSTGPHLHFEIRISGKAIDPEKLIEI